MTISQSIISFLVTAAVRMGLRVWRGFYSLQLFCFPLPNPHPPILFFYERVDEFHRLGYLAASELLVFSTYLGKTIVVLTVSTWWPLRRLNLMSLVIIFAIPTWLLEDNGIL